MAPTPSSNARLGSPCDIQCLQGNMRHSRPSLLCLFGDIANKNIYPKGVNIIFLTEPPKITTANKLPDIPGDIFNCFAEKYGRAALVTKGITSLRCPQYCSRDIVVCQAKLDNCLIYLVSMYLDQDILDFPPEFRELIQKRGDCDIIIGNNSNATAQFGTAQTPIIKVSSLRTS